MKDDQLVLCFPRSYIVGCERFTPWSRARHMMRSIENGIRWLPRWEAERSEDLMQLIPCTLVLSRQREYHVFRRINRGRQDLRKRISLVVGGHIDQEVGVRTFSSLVESTLMREIAEELGICPSTAAEPIGLVLDVSSVEASRHIGIVHEVIADGPIVPKAAEEFSFRSKFIGRYYTPDDLSGLRKQFDPWSLILFGNYINPRYSLEIGQQLSLMSR